MSPQSPDKSVNRLCVSIVVPVLNEAGNIIPLVDEIRAALNSFCSFEIIFVDDGSTDATGLELKAVMAQSPQLRCLRHHIRCGQSAAVHTGVLAARAMFIATLDGDGQNPPADLPKLIRPLLEQPCSRNIGIVCGQRLDRMDTRWKKFGSRVANKVRQAVLNDGIRDAGCGIKAFRRDAYLELPYFDHIHRFMPAMMRREGYGVKIVNVGHRPRVIGRSKYGNIKRAMNGFVDLIGVLWLLHRRHKTSTLEQT